MADDSFPGDDVNFKLVITHNVVSKSFVLEGHMKNMLVSLGMLHYAEQFVRMEISRARMSEELQNAPRIAVSNRLVT
jgi:hypothetical protein